MEAEDRGPPKRRETDHSSRAGAVSTGPSALDRSTGTVRSPVRSHDFVASQHAISRRHHCRRLRAFSCKKQVPASAAGAAGGQCGAPTAAPSAQDAAHHPRPSIEPGRTGAQRTSRRVRATRPCFLHRPAPGGLPCAQDTDQPPSDSLGPCRLPRPSSWVARPIGWLWILAWCLPALTVPASSRKYREICRSLFPWVLRSTLQRRNTVARRGCVPLAARRAAPEA